MSQHKINVTRSGSHESMGDWEAEYEITFSFTPGSPDTYDKSRGGPGGWDPGYPAEVEFISISPGAGDHGAFSDLAQKDLESWASEWLQDDGYAEAVQIAEQDREPDPDRMRDQRIDDALTERGQ
jgi:hypothetical protein